MPSALKLISGKVVVAYTQAEVDERRSQARAFIPHQDETPRCDVCQAYTYSADLQVLEAVDGGYSGTGSYINFRYCPHCQPLELDRARDLVVLPA